MIKAKHCQEGTVVKFLWKDRSVVGYVSWNYPCFPDVFVTVPAATLFETKMLRLNGDDLVEVLVNPHELAWTYVRQNYGDQQLPNATSVMNV